LTVDTGSQTTSYYLGGSFYLDFPDLNLEAPIEIAYDATPY